ncbi:MAG: hypothetical protein WCQ53_06965 [bacterium]
MFNKSIYLLNLLVLMVAFSACAALSHKTSAKIEDGTTGATPASLYFKADLTRAPLNSGYVYGTAVDLTADKLAAFAKAEAYSKDRDFNQETDSSYMIFNSDYSSAKLYMEFASDGVIQKFGDDVPVVNGIMLIQNITLGRLNFIDEKTLQITPVNYFKIDAEKSNMKTAEFYMDVVAEPSLDFIKAVQEGTGKFEIDANTDLFMAFDPSLSKGEALAQDPKTHEMMVIARLDISAEGIVTSKDAKDLLDKLTVAGDYSSATMLPYVAPDRSGIYTAQVSDSFNFTYRAPTDENYQTMADFFKTLLFLDKEGKGSYYLNKASAIDATAKDFNADNYTPSALVICEKTCLVNYQDGGDNKVVILVFKNKNTGKSSFMASPLDSAFVASDYPAIGFHQTFDMTINAAASATIGWTWVGALPKCLQPVLSGGGHYEFGQNTSIGVNTNEAIAANPACNQIEYKLYASSSNPQNAPTYTRSASDWPLISGGAYNETYTFSARVIASEQNILPSDFVEITITFDPPAPVYNSIGIIGTFTAWDSDIDMTNTPGTDDWYLRITLPADGDLKFRADDKWEAVWGNSGSPDFPSGTATFLGDNIAAKAGEYDVSFNTTTGNYSFVPVVASGK